MDHEIRTCLTGLQQRRITMFINFRIRLALPARTIGFSRQVERYDDDEINSAMSLQVAGPRFSRNGSISSLPCNFRADHQDAQSARTQRIATALEDTGANGFRRFSNPRNHHVHIEEWSLLHSGIRSERKPNRACHRNGIRRCVD